MQREFALAGEVVLKQLSLWTSVPSKMQFGSALVLCCLDHSCSGNSLSRVSLFVAAPRTRRSRLLMLREPCLKEACEELAPKNGTRRTCLCLRGAWRRLGGHTMKKTTYFTHACVDICYITFHISICKSCEKWLYFSFLDLSMLLVPPWHRAPSPWVGWSLLVWYASGPAIYPAQAHTYTDLTLFIRTTFLFSKE